MDKSSINVKAVLLSNIQLIIDNRETFKKNYKLEINEDSFDHPNNKAAFCILHYLMYKLYPKMSKNAFSYILLKMIM
ncbi:hypothetical protein HZS_4580 [Henneguya salminicola]|nr:hypothetical protein HZS_4580 [Henneguya salminicola]